MKIDEFIKKNDIAIFVTADLKNKKFGFIANFYTKNLLIMLKYS